MPSTIGEWSDVYLGRIKGSKDADFKNKKTQLKFLRVYFRFIFVLKIMFKLKIIIFYVNTLRYPSKVKDF